MERSAQASGQLAVPMIVDGELSPVSPVDPPSAYPTSLDGERPLPDGSMLRVRPIVPADVSRIRNAFLHGDAETIQRRFLTGAPPSGEAPIRHLAEVDDVSRLAILAMDSDGNSVGIARYEGVAGNPTAEIAVVVAPEWRRRGVAELLLGLIETPAAEAGIERLEAWCSPANAAIRELALHVGYEGPRSEDGFSVFTKALR